MRTEFSSCGLCPRACGADRNAGLRGRCHETATVRIARASLHQWEEPCLSGDRGSGTVFFTGCPLGCVFCQNYNIADGTNGTELTESELADVFLNGEKIGEADNMLIPHEFDVTGKVRTDADNLLQVLIRPVGHSTGPRPSLSPRALPSSPPSACTIDRMIATSLLTDKNRRTRILYSMI